MMIGGVYLSDDVLGSAGGGGLEDGVGLVRGHVVHTDQEHLLHTLPVSRVVLRLQLTLPNIEVLTTLTQTAVLTGSTLWTILFIKDISFINGSLNSMITYIDWHHGVIISQNER